MVEPDKSLPILDSHMHLDPGGDPAGAVRRFRAEGGTHLIIVHKPYDSIPISSLQDYKLSFQQTIEMTRKAKEGGIRAYCVVGPYPGELPHLAERMGLNAAADLQRSALDAAVELVENGEAVGLGEIGRIHFPVEDGIQDVCDSLMEYSMERCREIDCPVVLHTDSPSDNPNLMDHLARISDRTGLARYRVVKHYSSGDMVDPSFNKGLSVSVLSSRKNIRAGLSYGPEFLLETDYIDSRQRPDVVMPPDTVPKKIKWAYRTGLMDESVHARMMIDHPERVFGIDMS
ncbi:MAG: TatD family hydrolase [Thermoplasmatota archaeon]